MGDRLLTLTLLKSGDASEKYLRGTDKPPTLDENSHARAILIMALCEA
jgi:hypothetical protein